MKKLWAFGDSYSTPFWYEPDTLVVFLIKSDIPSLKDILQRYQLNL